MSETADRENYESGPFCRHGSDPADCEIRCLTCGHRCSIHDWNQPGECLECNCAEWLEEPTEDALREACAKVWAQDAVADTTELSRERWLLLGGDPE